MPRWFADACLPVGDAPVRRNRVIEGPPGTPLAKIGRRNPAYLRTALFEGLSDARGPAA